MPNSPRLAPLLLAATVLFGACGAGNEEAPQSQRSSACPDAVTIHATTLPPGFDDELRKGPGGGQPEVKDTTTFHWAGPGDERYIDVFRGGGRNKFKGERIRMLGKFGRYGEIDGGLAVRTKLGRGTCTRYNLEAFGVSDEDFRKVIAGLRRGPPATTEGQE